MNTPHGQELQIVNAMKRRGQLGGPGSLSRVAMSPHNPFIQNLDIPQDFKTRNLYKRHFYKTNPIVGSALELHSEFALSDFHLEFEDEAIEEFINDMLFEANFQDLLLMASVEYWLIGEMTMFSFFDDISNPSCYTGFSLLDPNKIDVKSAQFVQGTQKEVVHLEFDSTFKSLVQRGPTDPVTGDLYRNLPSDMVMYARADKPMPLSPLQVHRMKRNNYFSVRGESILERVFPLCMFKDKLRAAQNAIADRHIVPTELFKVGETNDPADQAELDALREAVMASFYDHNRLIFWHHAIQYEAIGTQGKIQNLWSEFDAADNEICAGLLLNKGLILGDSSTFASDVVRYDILINRYLVYRTKIERFIMSLIAPILKIHEMYVPENKVKSLKYREMCGKSRPLAYPTVRWEKQSLRDESARTELLVKLVEKGLCPESTLLRLLNMDPKTARQKVEEETITRLESQLRLAKKIQSLKLPLTPELQAILAGRSSEGGEGGDPGAPQDLPGGFVPDIGGGGGPEPALPSGPGEVVPGASVENPSGAVAGDLPGAPTNDMLPDTDL